MIQLGTGGWRRSRFRFSMNRNYRLILMLGFLFLILTGCSKTDYTEFYQEPDLVLYTPLTKDIYQPIVKEFENRTGLWVEVHEEEEEDIIDYVRNDKEKFPGDIVFGISKVAVHEYPELFPEQYDFSSTSFVIIYNPNIVIHNEIPENFASLLDEKWKGKVGFLDPDKSAVYQGILNFIQNDSHLKYYIQMNRFTRNTKGYYAESIEDIASGVAEGRYAAGIVPRRNAEQLAAEGKDIVYIKLSVDECIISNMNATTLNERHEAVIRQFLTFTRTEDVKKYLNQYLNYQPQNDGEDFE